MAGDRIAMAGDRIESLPVSLRRWLEPIQACERSGKRMYDMRERGLKQKSFYNARRD